MALELNSESIEYKDNKVIIKSLPKDGENLSVFIRPGDEVVFDIEGVDSDELEYTLIGGDIVVEFPEQGGALTFPSMGLMGFSSNPPMLNINGKGLSVENVLSKIQEINELPITSVDASFKVRVGDTDEDRGLINNKSDDAPAVIIVPQSQRIESKREDFTQVEQEIQKEYTSASNLVAKNTASSAPQQIQKNDSPPPTDFDAYEPDVEMIPKPDVEMIPKPEEDMIPDNGFTNDDDFTDYFPENENTGMGDGYGNGNGDGNGPGDTIPSFGFKATAHQVRFSEIVNADNKAEILGGGGSVLGYKNDSITNQFEPETIDISNRTEDMVIKTENSEYFSNAPASLQARNVLTFKDLVDGQSVTVDGLTLTASGAVSAAEVAAGFASLTANSDATAKIVTNATWSGNLSAGWSSSNAVGDSVTFTSTEAIKAVDDIVVTSSGLTTAAPADVDVSSSQDSADVYLSRVLRFEPNLPEGFYVESFSLEGLPSGVKVLDKNANELTGINVTKDDMVFKDIDGKVISYDDVDFLETFKSVEFTIKYDKSIADPFNLSITANYKVDAAFADSTNEPERSFTNEYTFALKEITSADDYTYNRSDFANAKDLGFILSKEPNYNIIKDGSGDNIIYGGIGRDDIYDAAGDDTYYLSAGDDTLYGGSGTNYIYGDSSGSGATKYEGTDTISYENVNSFGTSEIELLRAEGAISTQESQKLSGSYDADEDGDGDSTTGTPNSTDVDMLTSYKGVYVDLDGMHVDGLDIDVNGDGVVDTSDKINAISKFANRDERFTYDEDGYAVSTSIGKTISFTSTIKNEQVDDIVASANEAVAEVAAPIPLSAIDTVQGVDADTIEKSDITFEDLSAGQSIIIDGLKLTATDNITAAAVAVGFASLAASADSGNDVDGGIWSGALSDKWSSGSTTDATLTTVAFTSTAALANANVTDIEISYAGTSAVAAAEAIEVSTQQGGSDIDARQSEKTTIVFKDLTDGQSVSVGGLTLTASGSISALAVAAGFSNLSAGATAGNVVANGEWSGELKDFSSSKQESGLDSIQATGYDIYEDIENITGSKYNDTIYGNADKNNVLKGLEGGDILYGRGGDNKLYGGDGSDTLISGSGKDYMDGGADTDAVSYEKMNEGVTVRLDRPNDEEYDYTYLNSDLSTIKDTMVNIDDVIGSDYDDIIYGNSSTNFIQAGIGDDKIIAGRGYDFIDGGEGSDWISYHKSDYPDNANNSDFMEDITGGINVTMGADFVMLKENTETGRLIDLVKNIEQVRGTDSSDYIAGDGSDEIFWGMKGDDELRGNGGNDKLYGGDGDDTLRPGSGVDFSDGGNGTDFLQLYDDGLIRYSDNTDGAQKIRISESGTVQYSLYNLAETKWSDWTDGYTSVDGIESAINIEGLRASNGRAVNLTGNSGANILQGSSQDDIIDGAGGDDVLSGFQGNDRLIGGDGNDTFYGTIRYNEGSDKDIYEGGDGIDTLDYGRYNHNYAITATIDENYNGEVSFGGKASDDRYKDTFTSIERFIGSRGADNISASANTSGVFISGLYGNDTITGGSGDDTLYGGVHVDTIHGGAGNDYINLDQRSDVDERVHAQNGEYAYGGAGNDTIVSQGGRDYLYGDATDATDAADASRDTASDGDDTFIVHHTPYELHGGGGKDTLTLGDTYLDLRSTDIKDMEVLNMGDGGRTYFNYNQFFANNEFEKITGNENSQLFIFGSNDVDDTFDFSGVDLSGFEGTMYAHGYYGSGNDTFKIGGGTQGNQNVNMIENYFNTLEKFDIAAGSKLDVHAQNNSADYFHGHNKAFRGDGEVNFIGSDSNDIFYANFEALLDGKLKVDGRGGSDVVDIRTGTPSDTLDFSGNNVANMFDNLETLRLDNGTTRSNDIKIDAESMREWFVGDTFTLDLHNNAQGEKVTITNTKDNVEITNLEIGIEYNITLQDDTSFTMHVV